MNKREKSTRKFLDWIFEQVFDGFPDGGDIQDKAEELGLLVPVKVDPEKYEYCKEFDTDVLLFPYWTKKAKDELARRKRTRKAK